MLLQSRTRLILNTKWQLIFATALLASVANALVCTPTLAKPIDDAYKEAMALDTKGHPLEARAKLLWICSQPNATPPMYCSLADTYIDFEGREDSSAGIRSARQGLAIALQKDPQCGRAYKCLSAFANLKGEYADAAQYATRALSVKESDDGALRQRALAYSHLNRFEDAIKDQQAFIAKKHITPVNYMLLGDLQQAAKKYSDAEASYRIALTSGTTYQERSFNLLLKCLRLQGKEAQVTAEISKRLAKDPTDADMLDLRSQSEFKMKNYKDALRDCNAAIKESPLSMYYDHRAAVYDALGQKQQAADDRAKSKSKSSSEFDRF
jgi:tetratricopeptide (TPR) repeat protein